MKASLDLSKYASFSPTPPPPTPTFFSITHPHTTPTHRLAEQSKHALAFLSASAALEWQKKGSGTLGLDEAEAEEEAVPQLGHVKASKAQNGDEDEAADFPEDAEALEGQIATGEASATGGNGDDASSSQEDEAADEKADPPSPVSQPKKAKKVVKRKAASPAAEATPAKQAKKGSVKKGKKAAAKKRA